MKKKYLERQMLGWRVVCPISQANKRVLYCKWSDFKTTWTFLVQIQLHICFDPIEQYNGGAQQIS